MQTGNYDPARWRKMAREEAKKLDLKFEEVKGTGDFFKKISEGNWDKDFVIVDPGKKVTADMFDNN